MSEQQKRIQLLAMQLAYLTEGELMIRWSPLRAVSVWEALDEDVQAGYIAHATRIAPFAGIPDEKEGS